MSNEQEIPVNVTSIFGAQTRRGLVQLQIGDETTTMPPAKAREIAGLLLECAEAAGTDELLMTFFGQRVGLEEQQAGRLMLDFRRLREEFRERDTQG